jgi:hypothetical protein
MNITVTEPSARNDVLSGATQRQLTPVEVRRRALTLTAGAVAWSAVSYAYGFNPDTETGVKVTDLGALAFQVGAMALVGLQLGTRATGPSRKAAAMLKVERVLLTLAMSWSVLHALLPGQRETVWMGVLDAFWPLSMVGMFVIAVKVAVAGRWRGAARFWPVVAESWAVVCIPVMGIFGATIGDFVAATHLLGGYAVLGLILTLRPQLLRRD